MKISHIFITIIILCSSIFCINCDATHSMGADLTYSCLGGNNYKLRFSFYRDCSGVDAPDSVTIQIKSITCNDSLTCVLQPIPGTGVEITPICASDSSTCNGGNFTGIQEWVYEGIVTLPSQCVDWDFSYGLCCRNGAITTIDQPLNENLYIHSTLNNTLSPCNNSPTFFNKPVPFVCAGQQFCYNHGAYDVDGDSLVYMLIDPLGTGGVPVTYLTSYSDTQPINSVPPMYFNPVTGDFCATPQIIEVTVMAVLVQEYRNGVLIGEVERDMQITVIPCTNTIPNLSGINGSGSYAATICANVPYCFNVYSYDADASQNLTVTWDSTLAGGTLTTAGAPHPVGTFCWTPTAADASLIPHNFTITVHDDNCPFYGQQVYAFSLTVLNVTANAGPDQTVHCGGTALINATGTATMGALTYLWNNGVTSASQSVGPGTYTVTVSNGTCTASDNVSVILNPDVTAGFSTNVSCVDTLATFTDLSAIGSGSITGWSWSFGDGATSTLQNPVHQYNSIASYSVCLIVTNSLGCSDTICNTINTQGIAANFTVNNDCQGAILNLVNNSSASVSTYSWTFGNGNTSTLQNPVLSYSNAGTYPVSLIVIDVLSCSDTLVQQVTIYPKPVAAFTLTGGGLCQGGQVSLTDNSAGVINQWNWTFSNGVTSTLQNPTLTYAIAGMYNIKLVTTSDKGCMDSVTIPVTITMPFAANPVTNQIVCSGQPATLTASGGSSYLWNNGITTAAITITPGASTTYTVTVTDSKGCTDTVQATAGVFPSTILNISAAQSICIGQAATLLAGGAVSYTWLPGGITGQSINVSPVTSTTFTVTGTDVNGCSAIATVSVNVNALPVANLSNHVICPASSVTLDAGNPGSGYLWSTGATTQAITTSTGGIFSVTVTSSFGCTGTGQSIVVSSPLVPNVQSLAVCSGTIANLNAANTGNSYLWSTGSSLQNISVSATGTYTVTVTDINGCTLSFASLLTVNPKPVVNYTSTSGCLNVPTSFSNASYISSGSITGYSWSFGNGATSTIQNPLNQYGAAGTYNACLIATSNNGCVDTICKSITIHNPPAAMFTVNNNCQGNQLNISNTSSPAGITSYNWSFGNGTSSTLQSPTLSYPNAGSYNITLIVIDTVGCADTLQNQATVYSLPQVTINPVQPICSGQSATLIANGALAYTWLSGLGSNQSINVSPTVSTSYFVIGIDTNGCADTASINLVVNPVPVVNLTNPVICPSSSVTLNAGNPGSGYLWSTGATTQTISTSTTGYYSVTVTNSFGCTGTGQSIVGVSSLIPNVQTFFVCNGTFSNFNAGNAGNTYLWSTGSSLQNISATAAGTYIVTVTDSYGCTLSFGSTLLTNPLPVAKFMAGAVCMNDTSVFINNSTIASGSLKSYQWDFGDGTTSTDQNPKHQYANDGTFVVKLTVSSDSGCIGDTSLVVIVHPIPLASFTAPATCAGSPLIFTDNSTVSSGSISNHQWNFGDSTAVSTMTNPSHVYQHNGTYPVLLISVSNFGCSDSIIQNVIIHPNPVPNFIFDDPNGCGPLTVHFTDSSFISSGNITAWHWSFGDGDSSSLQNPAHTYKSSGSYTVALTTTTADGCANTHIIPDAITVYPDPVAEFTASPFEGGTVLQIISFDNQSINAIHYNWDFGDSTFSHDVNPGHNYSSDGTYIVTLVATSQYGCVNKTTKTIEIIPTWTIYIPNSFTPDNDGHNDLFNLSGIGIISYNIKIFNRWGQMVFDGDNRGWDGIHMGYGVMCKQDVYIYRVTFTVNIGGSHERTGQVTLMK